MSDESQLLKEEFHRMKTRYNVATKLELQTQEQLYESRLLHLESVLEEMKSSESQFLRLAEETNVLKDQVDYLRELSVNSMKSELPIENYSGMIEDLKSPSTTSPMFPTSPTNYHKALENELKTQFSSLYQSLSHLRSANSLEKDLIMYKAANAEPEVEEPPPPRPEPETPSLVVKGRFKVANLKKQKQITDENSKSKTDCFTSAFTKLWILFFD